jgi:hypothetical protein
MHKTFAIAATALLLGGCASLNRVQSDVSTYSQWPTVRAPATYAFERLPSQQSYPDEQQALEDAARPALEAAGFKPAATPGSADVSVLLGAHVTPTLLYTDPLWWGGGFRHGRHFWGGRGMWGSNFGWYYSTPRYEREVMLLIRDRSTGAPLYEARARNDGLTGSLDGYVTAMFQAAMKDFPSGGINPRRISIDLSTAQ